jgi:fucose 4-O-acetylase-like acetyltransferase
MQAVNYLSQEQMNGRIQFMDALKLFAIFLVLWGHAVQYLLSSVYYSEPMYRIIYSFHMPLFMMISGFFAVKSMKRDFIHLFITKFRQLILPVISWGALLWILKWILIQFVGGEMASDFYPQVRSYCIYSLWFLKSVFVCYMLAYVCYRSGRCKIIAFAVTCVAMMILRFVPQFCEQYTLITILRYLQLDVMFPSFIIGMLLHRYIQLLNANAKNVFIISLCVFVVMLLFWSSDFFVASPKIKPMLISGDYTDLILYIGKQLYRIVIGAFGSITFVSLACMVFSKPRTGRIVSIMCDWGKYTLAIYVLQSIILEGYIACWLNFDGMSFLLFNFIVAPTISLVVLVLCVCIAKLLMKNRLIALFLFGKRLFYHHFGKRPVELL